MAIFHKSGRKAKQHALKGDATQYVKLCELLAHHVVRLRGKLGLTQMEAAERADLGWRHLQKIERGRQNATLRTLSLLGIAFDVDASELLALPRRRGAR